MALKIVEFDSNWAFPDCNSSLNWPMAMKCCTKHETAKERCPIVLQGHPANFKVTRDKTSLILTQIGRFRIIGRSQLSNPSDLPCFLVFGAQITWTLECVSYHIEARTKWPTFSAKAMLTKIYEPHIAPRDLNGLIPKTKVVGGIWNFSNDCN